MEPFPLDESCGRHAPLLHAGRRDRPVDRRWRKAKIVVEHGVKMPSGDKDLALAVRFYRKLAKARRNDTWDRERQRLATWMPDISEALDVRTRADLTARDNLEGYLLAGAPPERVAAKSGLAAETGYFCAQLFFDVADRLDATSFISCMVIRTQELSIGNADPGRIRKWAAYAKGALFHDWLLGKDVSDHEGDPPTGAKSDANEPDPVVFMKAMQALCALKPSRDGKQMMNLYSRMRKRNARKRSDADPPPPWPPYDMLKTLGLTEAPASKPAAKDRVDVPPARPGTPGGASATNSGESGPIAPPG